MIESTDYPEESAESIKAIDGTSNIDFAMEPDEGHNRNTPEQDANNAMGRVMEGLGSAGFNPMVAPIAFDESDVAPQTEQPAKRQVAGGLHAIERTQSITLPTVEDVIAYASPRAVSDHAFERITESGEIIVTEPYVPVSYPLSLNEATQLSDFVWEEAHSLELSGDLLVLHGGRTKPPRNIGEYRFVPVLPDVPQLLRDSVGAIGQNAVSYWDVSFEYSDKYASLDKTPYMDAGIGLGLAYRDRLVAVCAGGFAREGLIIRQIQDVSNKIAPKYATPDELRKFKFSSGLHGSMDWRMTLVRAWSDLSQRAVSSVLNTEHKMPVWVQGSINNRWIYGEPQDNKILEPGLLRSLISKYDGVALAMGGVRDATTNNYLLPYDMAMPKSIP